MSISLGVHLTQKPLDLTLNNNFSDRHLHLCIAVSKLILKIYLIPFVLIMQQDFRNPSNAAKTAFVKAE